MGGLTRPDKAQQAPSISAVFSAFQDGFDRSLQFFSFPPCSIFSDNARGALSLSVGGDATAKHFRYFESRKCHRTDKKFSYGRPIYRCSIRYMYTFERTL